MCATVGSNVSRALQNILSKFVCCRNRPSCEHFKLKLCSCAQSHALGTRTKFQLEILTINVITGIVYFREIILESSRKVSETIPRFYIKMSSYQYRKSHCGDKTVVRSSYLHNGISYTGKMSSLYWIGVPITVQRRKASSWASTIYIAINSLWRLIKSLWRLINSLWRFINSLWRLINSLWRLIKSLWRLIKSLWRLNSSL